VTAIRRALLEGSIDLAVHSYKDLPTAPEPGLILAAVPRREDPRDALVARDKLTLGELPQGARVGTGAPRRVAQLRALGLGLEVVPIRGNVDTRLGKVAGGELDAVVLARAGLARLGRLDEVTETLDPLQVLPAPAQGALAVECRIGDARVRELVGRLEDGPTRACVTAERAALAALEAGCTAPVAAYAEVAEGPRAVPPRLGHRPRRQRRRPQLPHRSAGRRRGPRPRRRRRPARPRRRRAHGRLMNPPAQPQDPR
jgi:hydroxymethylbilane synthase